MANQQTDYIPRHVPKLNIEICALHSARRKLQSLSESGSLDFSAAEREAVLALIGAAKKTLYPDQMALDRYQYHLNEITKVDPCSAQFDFFTDKIEHFQNQYCE